MICVGYCIHSTATFKIIPHLCTHMYWYVFCTVHPLGAYLNYLLLEIIFSCFFFSYLSKKCHKIVKCGNFYEMRKLILDHIGSFGLPSLANC